MMKAIEAIDREAWGESDIGETTVNVGVVRGGAKPNVVPADAEAELALAEASVKVYLSKLFQKLGVTDRVELALYGMKNMIGDQISACTAEPCQTRANGGAVRPLLVIRKRAQGCRPAAVAGMKAN